MIFIFDIVLLYFYWFKKLAILLSNTWTISIDYYLPGLN